MFRWILAAAAALGLLASGASTNKSDTKSNSAKATDKNPVPSPQACTTTDGQPVPPGCQ